MSEIKAKLGFIRDISANEKEGIEREIARRLLSGTDWGTDGVDFRPVEIRKMEFQYNGNKSVRCDFRIAGYLGERWRIGCGFAEYDIFYFPPFDEFILSEQTDFEFQI